MDPRATLPSTRGSHTYVHSHVRWPVAQRCGTLRHVLYVPVILVHHRPLEEDLPEPPRMQFRLNRALRESFTSCNLPIPPLPAYRRLPRIAVQRDAPMPLRSCGTFAMSTALHILLGGLPPHTLPTQFITREHMLTMHRALLEWLTQGRPLTSGKAAASTKGPIPHQGHTHAHTTTLASQPQTYFRGAKQG